MSRKLEYVAPVFIGDTIVGEVEVLQVHERKRSPPPGRGPPADDEVVLKGRGLVLAFSGPAE